MTDDPTPPVPWPPLWAKTVAFFFGLFLATYELVVDHSQSFGVYGIALVFSGIVAAQQLETFYAKALGGGK